MANEIDTAAIRGMIVELRGERVILDAYLAMLYQVSTKRLMEQVKRNKKRFPVDFMFRLTKEEWRFLRSQNATSSAGGRRYRPYAFTRNGANMACTILKSRIAIQRSIQIMRAFSVLEIIVKKQKELFTKRPDLLTQLSTHSKAIKYLFQKDKLKSVEISKIRKVVKEMIVMLQQIVAQSI